MNRHQANQAEFRSNIDGEEETPSNSGMFDSPVAPFPGEGGNDDDDEEEEEAPSKSGTLDRAIAAAPSESLRAAPIKRGVSANRDVLDNLLRGDWYEDEKREALHQIFTDTPEAFREPDAQGDLPLHIALNDRVPVDIVELIYDAYPKAIEIADGYGNLPLCCGLLGFFDNHDVGLWADKTIIEFLIKQYPEARSITFGKVAELPLHIFCKKWDAGGTSHWFAGLFDAMIDGCEETLLCKDSRGRTPLSYIKSKDCDGLRQKIVSRARSLWINGPEEEFLRLLESCLVDHNITTAFLHSWPEIASLDLGHGRTPLHLACSTTLRIPNRVDWWSTVASRTCAIRALADAHPDALCTQDDLRREAPLHNLVRSVHMVPAWVTVRTLEICLIPHHKNCNVFALRDAEGWAPFQAAALAGASTEVVYWLLRKDPSVLMTMPLPPEPLAHQPSKRRKLESGA